MSDKSIAVIDVTDKPDFPLIPINPLDLPNEIFSSALNRRLDNRKLVMKAIKSNLKSGVHYGSIPIKKGTAKTKPCLFKSGGEHILSFLGLTAHYPSYPDYERAALSGINIELIILRCELHDGLGRVVAEGIGARNTAQDYRDINKSLKMASKSSMLSSVLNLGFSEIFTVDLEDMAETTSSNTSRAEPITIPITPEQVSQLESAIESLDLDQERVEVYCKKVTSVKGLGSINTLRDLPTELFDFILNKLPDLAEKSKTQAMAA